MPLETRSEEPQQQLAESESPETQAQESVKKP